MSPNLHFFLSRKKGIYVAICIVQFQFKVNTTHGSHYHVDTRINKGMIHAKKNFKSTLDGITCGYTNQQRNNTRFFLGKANMASFIKLAIWIHRLT
jgi:hypothetical protein